MNLHEYQAKQLLQESGLPISKSVLVNTTSNLDQMLQQAETTLGTNKWVVKAQIHAGGRGKAGGVKLVKAQAEAKQVIQSLLGKHLVTYQTTSQGQLVNQILVEQATDISKELYLGAVIDRASQRITFMASTEGGVDIEKVAEEHPEKIFKITIDPLLGVLPYQGRQLAFKLNLSGDLINAFVKLITTLGKLFVQYDLSLLEINPLVITTNNQLLCLDGKINIDDNALYRQPKLVAFRDKSQEDERELQAKEWELNYISLDGEIGCMVNGAGLAMATMDIIQLYGASPANFLDVGGTATKERVSAAFKIILSDPKVKAILVNIFGGIVRCDLVAEGIIAAVKEVGVKIPVVVRLEGTNAELGEEILAKSGLNLTPAKGLADAASKVVKMVK